jgi:cation transport ATPase
MDPPMDPPMVRYCCASYGPLP